MIENKNRILVVFIVLLIAGNLFLGYSYFNSYRELQTIKTTQSKVALNQKVINFANLFIKKVLQADTEVDFETRLSLENAVRDLNDSEIMAEWTNFIGSKTEADAQTSVKKLLGILITKIQK